MAGGLRRMWCARPVPGRLWRGRELPTGQAGSAHPDHAGLLSCGRATRVLRSRPRRRRARAAWLCSSRRERQAGRVQRQSRPHPPRATPDSRDRGFAATRSSSGEPPEPPRLTLRRASAKARHARPSSRSSPSSLGASGNPPSACSSSSFPSRPRAVRSRSMKMDSISRSGSRLDPGSASATTATSERREQRPGRAARRRARTGPTAPGATARRGSREHRACRLPR